MGGEVVRFQIVHFEVSIYVLWFVEELASCVHAPLEESVNASGVVRIQNHCFVVNFQQVVSQLFG